MVSGALNAAMEATAIGDVVFGELPLPIGELPFRHARVGLTYVWRHRRLMNLRAPARFTDLVQHRKLFDRDARMPALADKVRVKEHIARVLGPEWVIPTLWHGSRLPARYTWTRPFVVKSRHGCNQSAFVRDGHEDWAAIREQAARWSRRRYGIWLDEWLYAHVPRGLIVEPFIGEGGALPVDYKLFVFGGRVEYVQVHLGREHRHRWIVFDRDWRQVSKVGASPTADAPPPPATLTAMIAGAEELARPFDFVRVDFYEAQQRPMFGEMTFYPGSGLHRIEPAALDFAMGAHWLAARAPIAAKRPLSMTPQAA